MGSGKSWGMWDGSGWIAKVPMDHRWCAALSNKQSSSPGLKSFVMAAEQAPGPGSEARRGPGTGLRGVWKWANVRVPAAHEAGCSEAVGIKRRFCLIQS